MAKRTTIRLGKYALAGFKKGLKYSYMDGKPIKRGAKYLVKAVSR